MALGTYFLIFIGMTLAAILGVALLFWVKKENTSDVILVTLAAYSLVIAYMGANAQPVNFVTQQVIHWVIGSVAVVGAGTRFLTKKQSILSKVLVAASVLAGLYGLFFM